MNEIFFKSDKEVVIMHWYQFVMHENYVCFDLCLKISNFKVETKCCLYLEELVQFRDDLKMMKEFKTSDVIFCPLGEFLRFDLLTHKDKSIILKGYIRDNLFPGSDFEFSCKIDGKVVSDLIVASEFILNNAE